MPRRWQLAKFNTGSRKTSAASAPSELEWQTRIDLAALYRLVARYGMSDLIYNHITAKIPGTADHFLINSYGLLYEEVRASNLCVIDLEGRVISQPVEGMGLNYAGYVIHSAVHSARSDVTCVIHTHSRASMAVSAMDEGLLPLSQTAMRFYNKVSYHDYEGPAVNLDEQKRIVSDLGRNEVMFLRNHGTLVTGKSIAAAFLNLYYLENACRIQVDVLACKRPITICDDVIARLTQETFNTPILPHIHGDQLNGKLEWAAMIRMLERIDPAFSS